MGYIVDVSKYQGTIDWDKLKNKTDFVIIKASGKTKDPMYDRNASECKRLGIPFHAYHFVYAVSESAAKKEAKLFADSTKRLEPLYYVLDMEYDSIPAKKAKAIAETFEKELRKLVGNGIKVAVYIAHNKYRAWALDYSRYAYVWIPRYGKNTGFPLTKPDFYCDLWQYSSKGSVEGIKGNVDVNMLSGNKDLGYFTESGERPVEESQPQKQSLLGRRILKKGCKGDDVKELQLGLIKMGFDVGRWGADGDFGSNTKSAVKAFQKKYRLVVDGEFGPKSYKKWLEVL